MASGWVDFRNTFEDGLGIRTPEQIAKTAGSVGRNFFASRGPANPAAANSPSSGVADDSGSVAVPARASGGVVVASSADDSGSGYSAPPARAQSSALSSLGSAAGGGSMVLIALLAAVFLLKKGKA